MKSTVFVIFCLVTLAASDLSEFTRGNQRFSADIYRELAKINSGNILISPLSVQIVLALAQAGAKGETSKEISFGLQLPLEKKTIESTFTQLLPTIKSTKDYNLTTANKIYTKENVKLKEEFLNIAQRVFDSNVEKIDFSKKEETSQVINSWVTEKTNNKIHNLITPDIITPTTALILVNALHFQGKWKERFDKTVTNKDVFYVTPEKNITIDYMDNTIDVNFCMNYELNAMFIELPYEGENLVMTIVLPKEKFGLKNLESKIHQVLAPQFYQTSFLRVILPKFSMESKTQFVPLLQKLGINKVFSDEADLSGIAADDSELKINKIIQKTFIKVTEEGTEAAAATATKIVFKSLPRIFDVNHPFLFFVSKDAKVLFLGRFVEQTRNTY